VRTEVRNARWERETLIPVMKVGKKRNMGVSVEMYKEMLVEWYEILHQTLDTTTIITEKDNPCMRSANVVRMSKAHLTQPHHGINPPNYALLPHPHNTHR
jgi:hypothetical protein